MAVGFPAKTDFATGEVLTATNMNDITGTLNLLNPAAKGNISSASAANTPSNLAVGANGTQLVADSTTTTGLRWQSNYAAGKNAVINGAMQVAQRGTSITIAASGMSLDRYGYSVVAAVPTGTISQQTFTPGTAPVAGYEGSNFMRVNITANNSCTQFNLNNQIEDVRTFAGQTVTFSFWAKADAAATLSDCYFQQNFGSGGSATVSTAITLSSTALTTAWTRYTATIAVPSIAGKTIGTGSSVTLLVRQPISGANIRNGTYDYWGWQLEAGSVATAFQTATGTIQGELAACQRYYYRNVSGVIYAPFGFGVGDSTGKIDAIINLPVTMRQPVSIIGTVDYSTLCGFDGTNLIAVSSVVVQANAGGYNGVRILCTMASTATQYRPYEIAANNSTTAYIGFSAEL